MKSVFFAMIHRLRSTPRWSGMMALQSEDVAQHTFGVVAIAHALCVIDRDIYGKSVDVAAVLVQALYHDAAESILTDVIAPVKKYNEKVERAFKQLESLASEQLIAELPDELQSAYRSSLQPSNPVVSSYVKAADKLDALCKCKVEIRRGNQDFVVAGKQIERSLDALRDLLPAVDYFMTTFLPAFDKSIDEYRYLK